MPTKTTQWDASEFLETPEDIAAYLNAAMEDGDPRVITAAIGDVAKARGMSRLATTNRFIQRRHGPFR